jgi:hypothetical protein
MNIAEFANKYSSAARPIETVVRRWIAEKQVRDFLGMTVLASVTVADLIIGDRLLDTISPEVKEAFGNLMGAIADSREEIERLILDKVDIGDTAVVGLINKIQGQLGEDLFVRATGSSAHLAESGSQADWDVRVGYDEPFKYVQVKVYENANAVPLESLKDKLEADGVFDHDEVVNQLDIAVPWDIYDAVRERAVEIGYPGEILDLHLTRDEIRNQLLDSVQNVQNGLGHFFTELVGDIAVPAGIHMAVNAFLLYKGAKDRHSAVEDTLYSSAISAGGIIAAETFDQVLGHALLALDLEDAAAIIASPAGGFLLLGVGIATRAILRRFADRRFVVRRLMLSNSELDSLTMRVAAFN